MQQHHAACHNGMHQAPGGCPGDYGGVPRPCRTHRTRRRVPTRGREPPHACNSTMQHATAACTTQRHQTACMCMHHAPSGCPGDQGGVPSPCCTHCTGRSVPTRGSVAPTVHATTPCRMPQQHAPHHSTTQHAGAFTRPPAAGNERNAPTSTQLHPRSNTKHVQRRSIRPPPPTHTCQSLPQHYGLAHRHVLCRCACSRKCTAAVSTLPCLRHATMLVPWYPPLMCTVKARASEQAHRVSTPPRSQQCALVSRPVRVLLLSVLHRRGSGLNAYSFQTTLGLFVVRTTCRHRSRPIYVDTTLQTSCCMRISVWLKLCHLSL
jgi:hypothetical protein